MDKIWYRKSFEVGGHWPLWREWKKRMTTQNRQKANAKTKQNAIHVGGMDSTFVLYKYSQVYAW